ncbi:MAG TPA: transketolase [Alphaproteobacteria bacterium]|nr:transketolase [Alphaproteobacteria bacterium]
MPASPAASASSGPVSHKDMANVIRALSMDAVEAAKSGHPGLPMGMADVATVLFSKFLKFDPNNPTWADRDRFVHSAGHGSMLLYSLLYLTGYEKVTLDEIKNFRQLGALTAGHPEVEPEAGIETTTGPLGQGISTAVGMALAERILNARFGDDLVDHRTYVLCSDGDLMEGISHEACSLAGHLKLGRLIVLYDDNQISIDGPTSLSFSDDTPKRFEAYGWDTQRIDGHDPAAIEAAIAKALTTDTPSLIACRTTIGFGAPTKAGKSSSHGSPLGAEEIEGARKNLGWHHPPFVVPDEILAAWRAVGSRSGNLRGDWQGRLAKADAATREAFAAAVEGKLPANLSQLIAEFKKSIATDQPKLATRAASGKVLDVLVPTVPEMIGGSADLTGSNNTKTKVSNDISAGHYGGRYVNYGVREHGMAAAMNGMALHGGIIPYAGTFLTFADYCRPSIRLSALMHQRVVYVMTHDSIGLGEDGPTHQPVEHLAALRAIPNLHVFRPADAVETAEAWELMLKAEGTPSVIALTRQNLPTLRTAHTDENLTAKGAYVLAEAGSEAKVTLLATGSEVAIAVEAKALLEAEGIGARVVSMPCWELFEAQDASYRDAVLGQSAVRVGIEAAGRLGWDRWIGPEGAFVGMAGFGASGKYEQLYEHFGITAKAAAEAAKARL